MNTNMNMNLKRLTNSNLDQNLRKLVATERELLVEILAHIAEVDRRKLHLAMAYPSLFEYLTKHIGYSNGSAQRRIDAARLSNDVPDLGATLESGKINLSQVTLLQKTIRQVQTESKTKISKDLKNEIVNDLKGKTFPESELAINKALNVQVKTVSKTSRQQDESVRLEVTLTKEQWQKLEQMRELLSNSLPNGSWDQVLEYVADKFIRGRSHNSNGKSNRTKEHAYNKNMAISKNVSADEYATVGINENVSVSVSVCKNIIENESEKPKVEPMRTAIKKSTYRQILSKDQRCQYIDKNTKKQCGSKWQLNLDHIKPVWAGGTNEAENLRVLCAGHNNYIYRAQSNINTI